MSEAAPSIVDEIRRKSLADAKALTSMAERVAAREIELATKRIKKREEAAQAELEALLVTERSLAQAQAAAEAARIELETRQQLVDDLLDEVLKRLAEMPRDESYAAVLEGFIREAIEGLGEKEAAVFTSERDREFLSSAGRFERIAANVRSAPGANITLSGSSIKASGGAVVSTPDGRLSYYNTFDEIAYRRRSELRGLVAKELFG